MRTLSPKLPKLPAFKTIGRAEKENVLRALGKPLSGYLGGLEHSSGIFVNKLEVDWAKLFGVDHAIACNSATSGLYAACLAAGIGRGDEVWTTPFTMSATAAAPILAGAHVNFIDIEPVRYSINIEKLPTGWSKPKAIIVANIFGHPAYLLRLRNWCDQNNIILIEDNAQSPFAMEEGQYTGTIGHIGVFSFNIHKHIQAGEGGIITTNDPAIAKRLRGAINHGELGNGPIGLNLRMTEATAAIVCAQLVKAPTIIAGRQRLAHNLSDIFSLIPWVQPSRHDNNCVHVYYLWTARVPKDRVQSLVEFMNSHGVPLNAGYSKILCDVFDPKQAYFCPEVYKINESLVSFEVCAYNFTSIHYKTLVKIINKAKVEL